MDPFNLDMNMFPQFSENLINYKHYPSEYYEFTQKDETQYYGGQVQTDNFIEGFQKVFTPYKADNKKDIISEVLEINNIDDFITDFQKKLDEYYFNKEYENIIDVIEKRFPYFFNEKTNGLLYMLHKLKFYELLRQDRIEEAKEFYKEKLLYLVKEIKQEKWGKKNQFFIKLIKKPKLITKQGELQKKYYDKYTYELEKAIRNFLHDNKEKDDYIDFDDSKNDLASINSHNSGYHYASSGSLDYDSLMKVESNKSDKGFDKTKSSNEIKKNNIVNNEEEKDDLDIENCSTKEEFSDFEDEIQQKCVDNNQEQQEQNEIIEQNSIKGNIFFGENEDDSNDNIDSGFNYNLEPVCDENVQDPFSPFHPFDPKTSFPSKEKGDMFEKTDKNKIIIDTSSNALQKMTVEDEFNFSSKENKKDSNIQFEEINTNINIPKTDNNKGTKKNQKKKKDKKEETIFNQLPFLNSFKPKYVKRETIDKKVIRTFKNFLVKEYKERRFEINDKIMDQNFFINFINGNLFPPLDFHDLNTNEYIKFNSFNCSYLLWFFSKKGVKEIYNQFYDEKGKEILEDINQYYEISIEEKNKLKTYIMNYPNIFDISLVNNITQGTTVKHLYRTVDKNKKIKENKRRKKNDLDLKGNKSSESQLQRYRSRDFEKAD